MYQLNTKCTKWSYNIPNVCKGFQMAIKYISTFSNLRPSKIYPNWDFWFVKKPSGNPGFEAGAEKRCRSIATAFSSIGLK
jgi:hypothetical protein